MLFHCGFHGRHGTMYLNTRQHNVDILVCSDSGFVPRLRFQSGQSFAATAAVAQKEFLETQRELTARNGSVSPATLSTTPNVAPAAPAAGPALGKFVGALPQPSSARSAAPTTLYTESTKKPWEPESNFRLPGSF